MKSNYTFLYVIIVACIFNMACSKKDYDFPITAISRLYVSLSDTGSNAINLLVYDPADLDTLPPPYRFKSNQSDASGIIFNPYAGQVYQLSRSSKSVRTITPGGDTLAISGSFSDSTLRSPRSIAFARDSNMLFIAGSSDSSVSVYKKITTLNGSVKPFAKIRKLEAQPWDIFFDRNRLFIAYDNSNIVNVITNADKIDSTTNAQIIKFTIAGAARLHGIFYSQKLDMLFVTDLGDATKQISPAIIVIENANSKFVSNSVVNPNRIIRATLMTSPVDLSVDDRVGKGFIYVAEKVNKRILVFNTTDNGITTPKTRVVNGTPESLYIDSRDKSSVPGY